MARVDSVYHIDASIKSVLLQTRCRSRRRLAVGLRLDHLLNRNYPFPASGLVQAGSSPLYGFGFSGFVIKHSLAYHGRGCSWVR